MAYAIMRVAKHRSSRSVGGMGRHMNRTRETPNADPAKRAANATWMPDTGWVPWSRQAPRNLSQQLNERLDDFERRGGKLRKDSVLAIELMLSASPEWFQEASSKQRQEWVRRNVEWIEQVFGRDNVLQVALHLDETTPHLHVFLVPEIQMVETRGRRPKDGSKAPAKTPKPALAASHWLDGRAKLGELQDRYAAAMEPLGLDRGLRGSGAKHRTVRSYYGAAEAVMGGQEPALIRIPAPPPLPEPAGVREKAMAAAGYIPRGVAEENAREAAQRAAKAAAEQALQQAKEARAAAIEAAQQRRQLLDRLRAVGGPKVIERAEGLEAQLRALQEQQERLLGEARQQLDQVRAELEQAQAGRVEDAAKIAELREWGRGWKEHARALEDELYGPEQGPAGGLKL